MLDVSLNLVTCLWLGFIYGFNSSTDFFILGNIVIFVKPVNVTRGDRVVLTTNVLLATDGTDKPEELLYVITNPPVHGHIEYIRHPGLAISTFSQLDIAANIVAYVHDNRANTPTETFEWVSGLLTESVFFIFHTLAVVQVGVYCFVCFSQFSCFM